MATFLEDKNRIIIPTWREYKKTTLTPEHFPDPKSIINRDYSNDPLLIEKVTDWKEEKNIPNAIELINSSYSLGQNETAIDAAKFLIKQDFDLPKHLKVIANEILGIHNADAPSYVVQDDNLNTLFRFVGSKLQGLRKRLINFPSNPILWLEIARLHSILGNVDKAEKAITVAVDLSKGLNRYIIRAASRFFYHIDDFDRAHSIVRKCPLVKTDPWLMATEISYSIKQKRNSPNVKKGLDIISSAKYSNESISELSSMIGTLEFFNGSFKSARSLTNKALFAPNDNSLAQAEWLSRHLSNIQFDPWLEKLEYAYEARANEFYVKKEFKKSLVEGFNWVIDQPFSKRAIHFSSHLACGILGEYDSAIEICKFGLRTNPNSFTILNNLTYSLALKNEIVKAKVYFDKMHTPIENDIQKVIYSATDGLIDYRSGKYESGKEKYLKAIELAKKLKEDRLASVAEINFTRERVLSKELDDQSGIDVLTTIMKLYKDNDILEMLELAIKKILAKRTAVSI